MSEREAGAKSMADIQKESLPLRDWGPWRLRTETYELINTQQGGGGYGYEVDLERCVTSAETLDWICQVAHKAWETPEVLAGLVHAMNDVLRPQKHLCSGGQSKELSSTRVQELVREAAARRPDRAM